MSREDDDARADSLIERYAEAREALGRIQAWNPIAATADRCAYCQSGRRTTIGTGSRERDVCASCQRKWKGDLRHLIRGEVQIPARQGGSEAALASIVDQWHYLRHMIDLAPPFITLSGWRFIREGWILFTQSLVGGVRDVCDIGGHLYPQHGEWSPLEVEHGIDLGRMWVIRRLTHPRWREEERAMSQTSDEDYVGTNEASRQLRIHPRTVRAWVLKGPLVAIPMRPGAERVQHMIFQSSIDSILRRRQESATGGSSRAGVKYTD